MNYYPRIFALVCVSTSSVEYVSERYSKVSGIRNSMPETIRSFFEIVRYDPNENYKPDKKELLNAN